MKGIKLATVTALTLTLLACTEMSSSEHLQQAQSHLAKNNQQAAIIELKNAIRVDSQNADARTLLGDTYLALGDVTGAEKEYATALRISPEALENVAIPYAKTLYLQQKNDELAEFTTQVQRAAPETYTAILIYNALAKFDENETTDASALVDQAVNTLESSTYALLGQAMKASKTNDFDSAIAISNELIKTAPELPESWLLHGQLLLVAERNREAAEAFKQYVDLLPQFEQAKIYYAYALVKDAQYVEAEKVTKHLLRYFPDQALVNQLHGFSRFHQNDYEAGLLHIEKAIQGGQRSSINLIAAGMAAVRLEKYELAYKYFQPVRELLGDQTELQRIFSFVEIKLGYNSDALSTISSLEGADEIDLNIISNVGMALAQEGKLAEARKSIDILNSASSLTPEMLTKRGLLKLSLDDISGVEDLEMAVLEDENNLVAEQALASNYLRNNQFDKLAPLAEKLRNEYPNRAVGYNIEAVAKIKQGDIEGAQTLFEQAVAIEPVNTEANLYLAHQFVQNLNFQRAESHIESILAVRPSFIPALSLKYLAAKEQGEAVRTKVVDGIVKQAKMSSDPMFKLFAARTLFNEEDYKGTNKILNGLRLTDASQINNYWYLKLAVSAELDSPEESEAIFDDWISATPGEVAPWILKTKHLETLRQYKEAMNTIAEANKIFPFESRLVMLKSQILILNQRYQEARFTFENLSDEAKQTPFGLGLQGQIDILDRNFSSAIENLTKSYNGIQNSRIALTLFQAYRLNGDTNTGMLFLREHVKTTPNDEFSAMTLAQLLLDKEPVEARQIYQRVVKLNPNNFTATNNLAHLLLQEGYVDEAGKYVDKIIELAPNNIQGLDTAIAVKEALGLTSEAIALAEKAFGLSGDESFEQKAKELKEKS